MTYTTTYHSPLGKILLMAKDNFLIGLWIEGQKITLPKPKEKTIQQDNYSPFLKIKQWLDQYFLEQKPSIQDLPLNPIGSEFRKSVWKILVEIPYGSVTTYNDIAKQITKQKGIHKMSAQAVGNAVGHNPISIIIPCHRVVGTSGSLTGYAGGIDKKVTLLKHEKVDMTNLFIPKPHNKTIRKGK